MFVRACVHAQACIILCPIYFQRIQRTHINHVIVYRHTHTYSQVHIQSAAAQSWVVVRNSFCCRYGWTPPVLGCVVCASIIDNYFKNVLEPERFSAINWLWMCISLCMYVCMYSRLCNGCGTRRYIFCGCRFVLIPNEEKSYWKWLVNDGLSMGLLIRLKVTLRVQGVRAYVFKM